MVLGGFGRPGLESGSMTRFLALFVSLTGVAASAQTVRAPSLGRSALPGFGTLSAVSGGLTAASARPLTLSAPVFTPTLPAAAVLPVAAPLAPQLQPARDARAGVSEGLRAAAVPLARAEGNPSAQAPVLLSLFEGGRARSAAPVMGDVPVARPSLLGPARNAALPADEPVPAPPARPVWKTAGLYALRAAGFLGALYGGFRVGDMAYLGAGFLGSWGMLVSLPLLGAAAWWLGRRENASPLGRSVMGGLFASAGFVVVGQQFWDLFHTPLGLFVGIPVGVVLALFASGLLPRKRKFTGEPPALNPIAGRH